MKMKGGRGGESVYVCSREGEKRKEEESFNSNVYFPEKAKIVH